MTYEEWKTASEAARAKTDEAMERSVPLQR